MSGPGDFTPTFTQCSQCGLSHPPVPLGQKCPMAKDKIGDLEVDMNPYLIKLKPVIIANCQKKGIKNLDKLFSDLIILIQKYFESL
jgi:hypothetical protein